MGIVRYVCPRGLLQSIACVVWSACLLATATVDAQQPQHKRPATIEDAIRMVRIAGHLANLSYAGALTENFAYFSPSRTQFAIVLKKGNLERNTNDYSLILFRTAEVFSSPTPVILATMSSDSNREAITDIAWLEDNETVLFRGENPGEISQLYSVNTKTRALRQLTHQATNVIAFSSDAYGHKVALAAEKRVEPVLTEKTKRDGFVVSQEDMAQLLVGERIDETPDLFVLDTSSGATRALAIGPEWKGKLHGAFLILSLSPDGSQLVVNLNLTEVPQSWHNYREATFASVINTAVPANALSWICRYLIVDTGTAEVRNLFDGPLSFHGSQVVWADDSQSLVLTGVFLPIERATRDPRVLTIPSTVVIDVDKLSFHELSGEDLQYVQREGPLFVFETSHPGIKTASERRHFRQDETGWRPAERVKEQKGTISVTARQDLNTPPVIAVSDSSGRTATLLHPNPQFEELSFGKVQELTFSGPNRKDVHAGLYFPVDYVPAKKYPLVVQTHGFDPHSFWIDGSYTTAFGAQALAGRGFLVLQVPDTHDGVATPDEAPNMAQTIEKAIDLVDGMGILDSDRIGLIGFSRTGLYVHYLLAYSRRHYAAAVIADGSDGGYSQYLQFLNGHEFTAGDSEAINGGMPFGTGLLLWLRRSPEFSVDLVQAPTMLQVSSPRVLPSMWASFVALKRLGRAVELLYLPTGSHIMEKPWERLASQGNSVDWLTFWLKGEEDPDPSKAGKYQRWRDLRSLKNVSRTAAN